MIRFLAFFFFSLKDPYNANQTRKQSTNPPSNPRHELRGCLLRHLIHCASPIHFIYAIASKKHCGFFGRPRWEKKMEKPA